MVDTLYSQEGGLLERHVVFVSPEVPGNTGTTGRTCLGAGAFFHLIRPLGFSITDKAVKRAGLDYWHKVKLTVWDNFESFINKMKVKETEMVLFTKNGEKPFWTMPSPGRQFLIFGSETQGLPETILSQYKNFTYYVPITDEIRSLNLSTIAGIALYESLRLSKPFHSWPQKK